MVIVVLKIQQWGVLPAHLLPQQLLNSSTDARLQTAARLNVKCQIYFNTFTLSIFVFHKKISDILAKRISKWLRRLSKWTRRTLRTMVPTTLKSDSTMNPKMRQQTKQPTGGNHQQSFLHLNRRHACPSIFLNICLF